MTSLGLTLKRRSHRTTVRTMVVHPYLIRLMVGLLLIKQIQNISDEEVVVAWSENIYWQYFCGEIDIQYQAPCVANELTAFRKRIGQDGADYLFSQTVAMHGQQAQEKRTVVDSTVQEKNITYSDRFKALFAHHHSAASHR